MSQCTVSDGTMIEWPRHSASRIMKRPRVEWKDEILKLHEDVQDMVRKHIRNQLELRK